MPRSEDVSIRVAEASDALEISRLMTGFAHLFAAHPGGEPGERFMRAVGSEAVAGYIGSGEFAYFVAEADGELAGAAALRGDSHLYHLLVAPGCQGRGIARRLWERLRDAARERGNTGTYTVNASCNAVPVYERLGFAPVGPRTEADGIAFVPMERKGG